MWHRLETPDRPEPERRADNSPAYVLTLGPKRFAVYHEGGESHPHFTATVRRILARGHSVAPWPADHYPQNAADATRQVLGDRVVMRRTPHAA